MNLSALIDAAERDLQTAFVRAQRMEAVHFARVLEAFRAERVAQRHFSPTNGYGYGDDGRDTLERVFARVFRCEDALVRPGIASGTHALALCLQALLRPGQALLCASGAPYDTLHSVIGMDGEVDGSLRDFGIGYRQVDLEDGHIDLPAVLDALRDPRVRLVELQRSRGYDWRPALSVREIGEAAHAIHGARPDVVVMVDNCYGEFVEEMEPVQAGADVMAGSLIKNPGGGLAPTGGYIAGRADLVRKCADRLTSPGIGREVGSYAFGYQSFYQGLYFAPHVVSQALMTAMLFAAALQKLGFAVSPGPQEERRDIIQAIRMDCPERLIAFCRAIQAASPVDSHAVPEPWPMPGYDSDVIMAAGTFVSGASIELSADAPLRAPYTVYLQGGLTYAHGKYALQKVLESLTSFDKQVY